MLHELLFALNGHFGGLFQWRDDRVQVVQPVPFLHPAEVSQLNMILKLATDFWKLKEFLSQHPAHFLLELNGEVEGLHGVYLQAFCDGLNRVLEPYRIELEEIELEVLNDPYLPITHIESRLCKYRCLFQKLLSAVHKIKSQEAHGCLILNIVYEYSTSGIQIVKKAFKSIFHFCNLVLFKQLSCWLLYGILVDRYKEFFIEPIHMENTTELQLEPKDSQESVPDEDLQTLKLALPVHEFKLRTSMIPIFISMLLAKKVIFIGESICMFEKDYKEKKAPEHRVIAESHMGTVLGEKERDFFAKLQMVQQAEEFVLINLETVINEMRSCVAEHLWELVVNQGGLVNHLVYMKDFYLLGRGEFFLEFMRRAWRALSLSPNAAVNLAHDVNQAFQATSRTILHQNEEAMMEQFSLKIENPNSKSSELQRKELLASSWDCLVLEYNVNWPLHLVFTQVAILSYQQMFTFLIRVRKTQQDLHHGWLLHMQHKKSRLCGSSTAWRVRCHLSFVVDCLQSYLQADVLEYQFQQLISKIQSTRDFEEIQRAHHTFQCNALEQTFLLNKKVSKCVMDLLLLCEEFCNAVRMKQDIDNVSKRCDRQLLLLMQVLNSLRSNTLAQLLLRLNYNRYFTHKICAK